MVWEGAVRPTYIINRLGLAGWGSTPAGGKFQGAPLGWLYGLARFKKSYSNIMGVGIGTVSWMGILSLKGWVGVSLLLTTSYNVQIYCFSTSGKFKINLPNLVTP